MSAATLNQVSWHDPDRREPYQLPAGILALAVHGAFFALLYFGFAWQVKPLEMVSVELWQSLPETIEAPLELPKVEEIAPAPKTVLPEKMDMPDIALPDKKKVEARRTEKKPDKKKVDTRPVGKKSVGQRRADQDHDLLIEDQQAERELAEQAAAKGRLVNEYKTKIQNKITRNIVMPPKVSDDALAVFRVTLLPGGSVLSAEMKKSSGNAAYDNAVERAILRSDPLPLPPDAALFKEFRILELKFQPRK